MKKLEQLALFSVARGCGFGFLAIATLVVGLSGNFSVALRAGGYLSLLMCSILILMAWRAPVAPYKSTELWIMLDPEERPQAAVAQRVIGTILREAYLTFALRSAWVSAGMLVMAVLWPLLPASPGA
jgi:hypothetical protein